jgi:hypothetical protein
MTEEASQETNSLGMLSPEISPTIVEKAIKRQRDLTLGERERWNTNDISTHITIAETILPGAGQIEGGDLNLNLAYYEGFSRKKEHYMDGYYESRIHLREGNVSEAVKNTDVGAIADILREKGESLEQETSKHGWRTIEFTRDFDGEKVRVGVCLGLDKSVKLSNEVSTPTDIKVTFKIGESPFRQIGQTREGEYEPDILAPGKLAKYAPLCVEITQDIMLAASKVVDKKEAPKVIGWSGIDTESLIVDKHGVILSSEKGRAVGYVVSLDAKYVEYPLEGGSE